MEEDQTEKKKNLKKTIMMVTLIIIAILALVTSCSCTSNFFGKIGDIFRNEGEHKINDDTNKEKKIIKNEELTFDLSELEISESDEKTKLTFSYEKINPEEFTCTTSDASIATCYVENDYVVINPKKEGTVTVTLATDTNGNTYQATSKVTIKGANKYIELSSTKGTINLQTSKTKNVGYTLVGLTGDAKATSSDEEIATATIKNGVLTITAKKTGSATITVSIEQNGKTYKSEFSLTVIESAVATNPSNSSTTTNKSNSLLKALTTNKGTLEFNSKQLTYSIGVSSWTSKITLTATKSDSKAKIKYTFNGKSVSDLKNLPLEKGDNYVTITVTNGNSSTTYQVVINRAKSNDNYLSELSSTVGNINFDKQKLDYSLTVDNSTTHVSFNTSLSDKDSTVIYLVNGEVKPDLKDINLNTGRNVVSIIVKAPDGTNRTYTINIDREYPTHELDTDSSLKYLTIAGAKVELIPNKFDYSISITDFDKVAMSAVPNSPKVSISFIYNNVHYDNLNELNLEGVVNNLTIIVKAENNSITNYRVIINKSTSEDIVIEPSIGILNTPFDKNTYNYVLTPLKENIDKISFDVNVKGLTVTKVTNNNVECTLKDIELAYGNNVIAITFSNGKTYSFQVFREGSLDSELPKLDSLTVTGGILSPSFNPDSNTTNYSIENISGNISINLSSQDNITLLYNDNKINIIDLNNLDISARDENTLKIIVTNEHGSKTYTVSIKKPIVSLKSVSIKLDNGKEEKIPYDSSRGYYYKLVNFNNKEASITASTVDGSTVTYEPTNNITLNEGLNTIYMILSDGSKQKLVIERPKLELKIAKDSYDVYYESSVFSGIEYKVYTIDSNGQETKVDFNKYKNDIKINGLDNRISYVFKDSVIQLNFETDIRDLVGKNNQITIECNGKISNTTTINFLTNTYLRVNPTKYLLNVGERNNITIYSNLLNGTTKKTSGNSINITSDSRNTYINVTLKEDNGNIISSMQHKGGETSASIDVEVIASASGNAKLEVTGYLLGEEIGKYEIELTAIEKNVVNIFAYNTDNQDISNAIFNTFTDVYSYKLNIDGKEKVNLANIDIPYVPNTKYSFMGYYVVYKDSVVRRAVRKATAGVELYITVEDIEACRNGNDAACEKCTIDGTRSLDLYAVYDLDENNPVVPYKDEGTLWLYDVPLFQNAEYYEETGEEKLIYPGASGRYDAYIYNTKDKDIDITGITLKEEPICVDNKCLNMGYIVKYGNNYLMGASEKYAVLNQQKKDADGYTTYTFNEPITALKHKGNEIMITIHWKWVEIDDEADSKIGQYVANTEETDYYNLQFGINFETKN